MGGPPLILYGYRAFEPKTARRLLIAAFTLAIPFRLFMILFKDLVTPESLILALYILPGSILGTIVGNRLQKKINKEAFQKVIWILLLILGIILGGSTVFEAFHPPAVDKENVSWINAK